MKQLCINDNQVWISDIYNIDNTNDTDNNKEIEKEEKTWF